MSKTVIIITVTVGAILVIGFIVLWLYYNKPSLATQAAAKQMGAARTTYTDKIDHMLKLKKGNEGNNVVELQKRIAQEGQMISLSGKFDDSLNDLLSRQIPGWSLQHKYDQDGFSYNDLDYTITVEKASGNNLFTGK